MSTITEIRPTSTPRDGRQDVEAAASRRRRSAGDDAVSPRPAKVPARLTRRGRWVVTVLILGCVLALSVALGSRVGAAVDPGEAPTTTSVVVGPGQSLWSIASDVAAPGETREVMYEIERLNQLESSTLVPGQRLLVPAR